MPPSRRGPAPGMWARAPAPGGRRPPETRRAPRPLPPPPHRKPWKRKSPPGCGGLVRKGRVNALFFRVLQDFLHITQLLLGRAFDLLGNALGLLLGAVDQLASLLLHLACGILERALDLIRVHSCVLCCKSLQKGIGCLTPNATIRVANRGARQRAATIRVV